MAKGFNRPVRNTVGRTRTVTFHFGTEQVACQYDEVSGITCLYLIKAEIWAGRVHQNVLDPKSHCWERPEHVMKGSCLPLVTSVVPGHNFSSIAAASVTKTCSFSSDSS